MNILRTLKLREIFEYDENLSDKEIFFFSQFEGLLCTKVKNSLVFYKTDGSVHFEYNLSDNRFWCSYPIVWSQFRKKYAMTHKETVNFIKNTMVKHFGFTEVIPRFTRFSTYNTFEYYRPQTT